MPPSKKKKAQELILKIGSLTQAVDAGKLCSTMINRFGGEDGLAEATVAEFYSSEAGSPQRARILELVYKVLEAKGESDDAILKDIDQEDLVAALSRAVGAMEEEEKSDKSAAPAAGEGAGEHPEDSSGPDNPTKPA